jgi:hypothetical protein
MQMRCRIAFNSLLSELVVSILQTSFEPLCVEVAEEAVCHDVLYEVTDSLVCKEIEQHVASLQKELAEAHGQRERRAVADRMQEVVVTRLLLAYLMSSIGDRFATVQVYR